MICDDAAAPDGTVVIGAGLVELHDASVDPELPVLDPDLAKAEPFLVDVDDVAVVGVESGFQQIEVWIRRAPKVGIGPFRGVEVTFVRSTAAR